MKLSVVFDRKRNALNAVRLILATSVIFIHSFALSGNPIGWRPAQQLFSDFGVDGFFAISGFLIVASWINRPRVGQFLESRVLRIFPAFYVCLLVTAFILAPVSSLISGSWGQWQPEGSVAYVLKNAGLWMFEEEIPGTLQDIPYPGVWNVSMWTLSWEFLCYVAVMSLGLLGLLKRGGVLYVAFVACWLALLLSALGLLEHNLTSTAARFGLMFTTGALFYFLQHRINVTWARVGVAAVIVLASAFLPDYRLLAAPSVAYVCIGVGALVKDPRAIIKNDISYGIYIYAFPLQQLIATAGVSLGPFVFAMASLGMTIPFAIVSWFLVEKPAMGVKGRIFRREEAVSREAPTAAPRT